MVVHLPGTRSTSQAVKCRALRRLLKSAAILRSVLHLIQLGRKRTCESAPKFTPLSRKEQKQMWEPTRESGRAVTLLLEVVMLQGYLDSDLRIPRSH